MPEIIKRKKALSVNPLKASSSIGAALAFRVDLDLDEDDYDDDDDGFSDDTSMVMSLKDLMDCIGCQACSRVCPKKCLSHEPAPMAA